MSAQKFRFLTISLIFRSENHFRAYVGFNSANYWIFLKIISRFFPGIPIISKTYSKLVIFYDNFCHFFAAAYFFKDLFQRLIFTPQPLFSLLTVLAQGFTKNVLVVDGILCALLPMQVKKQRKIKLLIVCRAWNQGCSRKVSRCFDIYCIRDPGKKHFV